MKGANESGDKDVTRRVSLPRCPQESFVPTILGCAPRAEMVSASRSSPAVTLGKLYTKIGIGDASATWHDHARTKEHDKYVAKLSRDDTAI